jgi:hypothetical protein
LVALVQGDVVVAQALHLGHTELEGRGKKKKEKEKKKEFEQMCV